MRRPFDSLFGRLALLVVAVLLASHFAWFLLLRIERSESHTLRAVEETVFLLDAVRDHLAHEPNQPLPSRVHLVDSTRAEAMTSTLRVPVELTSFVEHVRDRLPNGSMVRIGLQAGLPTLWVREAGDGSWIVMPLPSLRPPHSQGRKVVWLGIVFSLAVMAALLSAWRLQQPLTVLTQAVGRFRRGEQVPRLPERGPGELRALTHGFNQMVQEVARTESDRAAMLTGVAHDLRTPLARLRLRAELTDDVKLRDCVMRDVDAMAHIVDQFLVFAHGNADRSEPVEVDAQCVRVTRSYRAVSQGTSPVQTKLMAGSDFLLPAATLERIVTNLLDNAYTYGAPPIRVATSRTPSGWLLSVSDQGRGIAPKDLADVSRPFVRLDPARGGDGHSGLGLAIVEQLVNSAGGILEISNAKSGGLRVAMTFPGKCLGNADES